MKHGGFLVATTATGVGLGALAVHPASPAPSRVAGHEVADTGWRLEPCSLVFVRRWALHDVCPDGGYGLGPHVATARMMTMREARASSADTVSAKHERDALADLAAFLRNDPHGMSANTVRFRDGDILPCQRLT